MRLVNLNASVVVLAKHHNPTILHPSFLASAKIVPDDWETSEPPVSTPVFALVKYKNGIVFNVEESKFQVTDNQLPDKVSNTKINELAFKYVEKLPHVNYTAVGVNFQGFIESDDAEKILKKRFLSTDSNHFKQYEPDSIGLRFNYHLNGVRLNLSFDSGSVKKIDDRDGLGKGIIVNANYHSDLVGKNGTEEIKAVLFRLPERHQHYTGLVKALVGVED